jgi:fucokinase
MLMPAARFARWPPGIAPPSRMTDSSHPWHYLILTAANRDQAATYRAQLRLRRAAGQLAQVRDALVVADPQGCRVGSGGSTLECLLEILRREARAGRPAADLAAAARLLAALRILIVHAGGDSRRLPAYSPCGKIFVPLPGDSSAALAPTLFDRLVPAFLGLPAGPPGAGQIVVASGDALVLFDCADLAPMRPGLTALASLASPAEAARHGVLCPNPDGSVRLYLQKPAVPLQAAAGAIGPDGRSALDIGLMSLDAATAVRLLAPFCAPRAHSGTAPAAIAWTPAGRHIALSHGIDLYREICCALGTDSTFAEYLRTVRTSGSRLDEPILAKLFDQIRSIPFHLQVLRQCGFLHFGTTAQLISSGLALVRHDTGAAPSGDILAIGSAIHPGGSIHGAEAWVEGCRLDAPLSLAGRNVVVGVDVSQPFHLPAGGCLDLNPGVDRQRRPAWFIRYYGIDDTFKHSVTGGATFCGQPLAAWLRAAAAPDAAIWTDDTPAAERTLWNARVFPAESAHQAYRNWRWMLDIERATPAQVGAFLAADRYSSAEIAVRVDHHAFLRRRAAVRADELRLNSSPERG